MSCISFADQNGLPVHISVGGPDFEIKVNGKWVLFEDHHYCGPTPLNRKTGNPHNTQPSRQFWDAIERWTLGGKRLENINFCVVPEWCARCSGTGTMIVQRINRRNAIGDTCSECYGKRVQQTRD